MRHVPVVSKLTTGVCNVALAKRSFGEVPMIRIQNIGIYLPWRPLILKTCVLENDKPPKQNRPESVFK